MIQAVIFDCFGVLTTDGWLAFRERYLDADPPRLERGVASNKRVDAGLISYDDFIHEIADLAGVSIQQTLSVIEGRTVNEKLFTYIRDQLKPACKIGMLSNAADDWLDQLFEPWQNKLFDQTVLSYQVGVIKPDPLMYQTVAERLGVLPEECIFIDDQQRYVDGAVNVGMRGVHFTDTQQTMTAIEELLHA